MGIDCAEPSENYVRKTHPHTHTHGSHSDFTVCRYSVLPIHRHQVCAMSERHGPINTCSHGALLEVGRNVGWGSMAECCGTVWTRRMCRTGSQALDERPLWCAATIYRGRQVARNGEWNGRSRVRHAVRTVSIEPYSFSCPLNSLIYTHWTFIGIRKPYSSYSLCFHYIELC